MWYLWIFGDNVEDRMGHFRFLVFYLLCGLLAGGAHLLFNLESSIPSIGASGAVAGVLGAYLLSYPFARVATIIPLFLLWPIVELPAVLVLGVWFLVQLSSGFAALSVAAQAAGGIAWWAHIGGFLSGMLLIGIFARPVRRRYEWETAARRSTNRRQR
jgi:membrane associated rhomboid family serine protease